MEDMCYSSVCGGMAVAKKKKKKSGGVHIVTKVEPLGYSRESSYDGPSYKQRAKTQRKAIKLVSDAARVQGGDMTPIVEKVIKTAASAIANRDRRAIER